MSEQYHDLCPHDLIVAVTEEAQIDDGRGFETVEALLQDYRRDPRLHFIRGSLLAASRLYIEANQALRQAIDLAPDFAAAHYQLGLLELISGNPLGAQIAWKPLLSLPSDNALRLFSEGLQNLARDKFPEAKNLLERGIRENDDNPAVNDDIRSILDKIQLENVSEDPEPLSATQFLLRQDSARKFKQ